MGQSESERKEGRCIILNEEGNNLNTKEIKGRIRENECEERKRGRKEKSEERETE